MKSPFRLGDCIVDVNRLSISRGSEEATVEPKIMAVLEALAERSGEVVSMDELIDTVWDGRALGDNPVYGAIAKLRRALGDEAREPRYIETVARRGYRLAAVPTSIEDPAASKRSTRALVPITAMALAAVVGALIWLVAKQNEAPLAEPASSTPPAIAVVPFANVSGDPNFDFFGDGFSEDVLNTLARIDDLKVIARSSAFALGGQKREIPELAATLGVGYVLAGTVHPEGERLRVSARLLDAEGQQLWGESYDRPLEQSLDVRLEVADAIARKLARTLTQQERTGSSPVSTAALQSYLAGREYTWLGLILYADDAIRAYRRAIELDPDYADAHAGLARVFVHERKRDEARRHAERALALSPRAAEAHLALGLLAFRSQSPDRYGTAEGHMREAIRLNPSLSEPRHYLAMTLRAQGRMRAALEERRIGLDRDPLHYNLNRAVARAASEQGDLERALTITRRALEWPQLDEPGLEDLSLILWEWSRFAELLQRLSALGSRLPDPLRARALAGKAAAYGKLGLLDQALAAYDEARAHPSWPGPRSPTELRLHYLGTTGNFERLDEELVALTELTSEEGDSRQAWVARRVGVARIQAGRFVEGIAKIEVSIPQRTYFGEVLAPEARQFLALAYRATGDSRKAESTLAALLDEYRQLEQEGFVQDLRSQADIARIHALAGNREQAMTVLARLLDLGWVGYYELRDDPRWAGVRDHSGFDPLLAQALRVVESQRAKLQPPSAF